ncbi:MAG: hypothetical protein H7145_07000 [Akkermansiaceae bacterium]|nr:hypothetical protein [Armatimonadota bacterium]
MNDLFTLDNYKGSRYDENIESDLLREIKRLPDAPGDVIGQVIRSHFPETKFTLLLHWLPEQGEDIYRVLMDDLRIAVLEIPRRADVIPAEVVVEIMDARSCGIRSRHTVPRFSVAVKLMEGLLRESREAEQRRNKESAPAGPLPPINTVGLIKQGNSAGWYVRIQDERQSTGGYFVFLNDSRDFSGQSANAVGYDDWVLESELGAYMKEREWVIEWD